MIRSVGVISHYSGAHNHYTSEAINRDGSEFLGAAICCPQVAASFQLVRAPALIPQVKNSWPRARGRGLGNFSARWVISYTHRRGGSLRGCCTHLPSRKSANAPPSCQFHAANPSRGRRFYRPDPRLPARGRPADRQQRPPRRAATRQGGDRRQARRLGSLRADRRLRQPAYPRHLLHASGGHVRPGELLPRHRVARPDADAQHGRFQLRHRQRLEERLRATAAEDRHDHRRRLLLVFDRCQAPGGQHPARSLHRRPRQGDRRQRLPTRQRRAQGRGPGSLRDGRRRQELHAGDRSPLETDHRPKRDRQGHGQALQGAEGLRPRRQLQHGDGIPLGTARRPHLPDPSLCRPAHAGQEQPRVLLDGGERLGTGDARAEGQSEAAEGRACRLRRIRAADAGPGGIHLHDAPRRLCDARGRRRARPPREECHRHGTEIQGAADRPLGRHRRHGQADAARHLSHARPPARGDRPGLRGGLRLPGRAAMGDGRRQRRLDERPQSQRGRGRGERDDAPGRERLRGRSGPDRHRPERPPEMGREQVSADRSRCGRRPACLRRHEYGAWLPPHEHRTRDAGRRQVCTVRHQARAAAGGAGGNRG